MIVLDISMPGMTGLEVASRLRKSGSKAAVVFLTVHFEEDFKEAALSAGGIGYVLKPRLASDLIAAVQEAQAGRRSCLHPPDALATVSLDRSDDSEALRNGGGIVRIHGLRVSSELHLDDRDRRVVSPDALAPCVHQQSVHWPFERRDRAHYDPPSARRRCGSISIRLRHGIGREPPRRRAARRSRPPSLRLPPKCSSPRSSGVTCRSRWSSSARPRASRTSTSALASRASSMSVDFAEGTLVRKGQVLYRIDRKPLEASLADREADLATAQAAAGENARTT